MLETEDGQLQKAADQKDSKNFVDRLQAKFGPSFTDSTQQYTALMVVTGQQTDTW